jgi:hypothetical protein
LLHDKVFSRDIAVKSTPYLKNVFAQGESGIPKGYTLWPPEAKSPDNPAEGGFPFCFQQL